MFRKYEKVNDIFQKDIFSHILCSDLIKDKATPIDAHDTFMNKSLKRKTALNCLGKKRNN